jgi:tetratricopeptide (TPR) repeat protein
MMLSTGLLRLCGNVRARLQPCRVRRRIRLASAAEARVFILPHTILFLVTICAFSTMAQQKPASNSPDLSLTAVGRQHHTIDTKSKEAQAYFDQGLTFIYGFNHEEAQRAFQRVAELDPASPMPLWGIALAVGPNYNSNVDAERERLAFDTIQKARKLSEHAPVVEQDYVQALAARFSGEPKPDYPQLARNYVAAMKALSQKYPDDLDAATFYAESLMDLNPWNLWTHDGQPTENTLEIVRILESVLARDPDHAGANHFYIHAVEASPNPERALPSARRLDTMVPQAGHLVHMPAHIYIRTGDYAAAVKNNEEAAKVDTVYAREAEQQGSMYDLMYHSHNEHFLASAACMEGNYAVAKAAADAMATRLMPHAKTMPMLDFFILSPLWVDVRFNQWDAILAKPEPTRELPATHVMWRYARTQAFLSRGEKEKGAAEHELFAKEVAAMPADARMGQFNSSKDLLNLASQILDARVATARGSKDEAMSHWQKAVELQDALRYNEPPEWYYPVRESLGAALLADGKPTDAEQVFREDLKRNPRNPRSLFGLMHTLQAQHKDADASWVESQFQSAWKNADTTLDISTF